jgi:LPS-assembly lipoprotein
LFEVGGSAAPPPHRLNMANQLHEGSDHRRRHTSRPDIENYGINATYSLNEIATAKVVVTRQTFVWVSYDIPTHDGRTTVESFETERAGAGSEESGPI